MLNIILLRFIHIVACQYSTFWLRVIVQSVPIAQGIHPLSCEWVFGCLQLFALVNSAALSIVHNLRFICGEVLGQWPCDCSVSGKHCQAGVEYLFDVF